MAKAAGAYAIDVGAWTVFLYTFGEREKLYKLFEELTGARFTTKLHPDRRGGAGCAGPAGPSGWRRFATNFFRSWRRA